MEDWEDFESLAGFITHYHKNKGKKFWINLQEWAREHYKKDTADGSKPEIVKIFAGFDEEAMEDTSFW